MGNPMITDNDFSLLGVLMKMWSTVCPQLCILFSSNTFYFTLTGRWWQEWFTRKDRSHRAEGKTLSYGLCRCCSVLMPFLREICLQKRSHFFYMYEKKNKELMLKRCIGIAVIYAKCRLTAPLSWGSHKYFAPLHFLSFASFSKHWRQGKRGKAGIRGTRGVRGLKVRYLETTPHMFCFIKSPTVSGR